MNRAAGDWGWPQSRRGRAPETTGLSIAESRFSSAGSMSYDLARLLINALIERREHTNTYDLTQDVQRVAFFYTKVHDRLLRPLLAANRPPAPAELRHALTTIDRHIHTYTDHARLGKAA